MTYEEQLAVNREYHKAQAKWNGGKGRNRPNRDRNLQLVRDLKEENPCTDCGQFFPFFVMEFDHRDRTEKYKKVSSLYSGSTKKLLEEIAKCDLVCANCHKFRTYNHIQEDDLWGSWRKVHGPKEDHERVTPKGWLTANLQSRKEAPPGP